MMEIDVNLSQHFDFDDCAHNEALDAEFEVPNEFEPDDSAL
jgi:hypothetical protein